MPVAPFPGGLSRTMVTFLLESLIFILIGFELPRVTRALVSHPLTRDGEEDSGVD